MRRHRLLLLASLLAAVSIAEGAAAQWLPYGVSLSGGNSGDINLIVTDGAGGAYVLWRQNQNSSDVYLQRVTASGLIAPGWPIAGLPLATTPDPELLADIEPDGVGGVFVVWYRAFYDQDFNVEIDTFVQRIQPGGTPAPGWPAGGVRIFAPARQDPVELAADGSGGVFVVWQDHREFALNLTDDLYAQHLFADGTVAPGWPSDGLPLAIGPSNVIIMAYVVPDGQGGAHFIWNDDRNIGEFVHSTFASRVHADGSLAGGWVGNGLLLVPRPCFGAISDGTGGFYLLTSTIDPYYGSQLRYYLSRITADGTPAPGWPAEGLLICDAPENRNGAQLVSDGFGGALVTWYDYRVAGGEIYVSRVLPGGTLAPGWAVNGTRISDPTNSSAEYAPQIVDDSAGGAYVVWVQNGPAAIQHVTATGQPAPGWPQFGQPLASSLHQFDPKLSGDGEGGAIVAWNEACCGKNGVWAQRYVAGGIVAVQLSLVSAVAEADRVSLEWFAAAGSGLAATVERRSERGAWLSLASITADGTGHLRFEDRDVTPGNRYAYRLSYREGELDRATSEAWVEIPPALELALAGFVPNPAVGPPTVSFTLPAAAAGRLEIFDLAGRRVAEQNLAGLPAGRHLIRLAPGTELPPAAYVIRLTHRGRTLTARGVAMR